MLKKHENKIKVVKIWIIWERLSKSKVMCKIVLSKTLQRKDPLSDTSKQ